MEWKVFLLILAVPLAIYIVTHIASTAHYRAKHNYLKKVMKDDHTPPDDHR